MSLKQLVFPHYGCMMIDCPELLYVVVFTNFDPL